MIRVAVTGGRNFDNEVAVETILAQACKQYGGFSVLIHGGATGADYLAKRWAQKNNIPILEFAADWDQYGKKAGPLRNQQIVDEGKPNLVIRFPGNRGTEDMTRRAEKAGITVLKVLVPVGLAGRTIRIFWKE